MMDFYDPSNDSNFIGMGFFFVEGIVEYLRKAFLSIDDTKSLF